MNYPDDLQASLVLKAPHQEPTLMSRFGHTGSRKKANLINRLSKIIDNGLLLLSFLAVNEENKLITLIKVWAFIKALPKAAKKIKNSQRRINLC